VQPRHLIVTVYGLYSRSDGGWLSVASLISLLADLGVDRLWDAFADYVRVLTDWRHLPYLDPGLPEELLPEDWIGIRAADLFFTLKSQLEEAARAHVTDVITG
jgi:DNA-binding transcriptional regulator PaaX